MSIIVIWQPPDVWIKAMNTAIINLADEGVFNEKLVHYEIFIFYLNKMLKTKNMHFNCMTVGHVSDSTTTLTHSFNR